jgi:hypothetical protein
MEVVEKEHIGAEPMPKYLAKSRVVIPAVPAQKHESVALTDDSHT